MVWFCALCLPWTVFWVCASNTGLMVMCCSVRDGKFTRSVRRPRPMHHYIPGDIANTQKRAKVKRGFATEEWINDTYRQVIMYLARSNQSSRGIPVGQVRQVTSAPRITHRRTLPAYPALCSTSCSYLVFYDSLHFCNPFSASGFSHSLYSPFICIDILCFLQLLHFSRSRPLHSLPLHSNSVPLLKSASEPPLLPIWRTCRARLDILFLRNV